MRSSWNGAMAVGLLAMPVKLYRVTSDDEIKFRQIHDADNGPISYRRVCSVCGEEVPSENIAKGQQVGDQIIAVTDEELDTLPTRPKEVSIERFVPFAALDLTAFGNAYYVEPDANAGLKVYTLLRQALKSSNRVGIAKFALRTKDSLAVIRPQGKLLILQLMAWPSDVREPSFKFTGLDVSVTEQERELASQLIDTLSGPWNPDEYRSEYRDALAALMEAKMNGTPRPEPTPQQAAAVADIGAVLAASIEQVKAKRGDSAA